MVKYEYIEYLGNATAENTEDFKKRWIAELKKEYLNYSIGDLIPSFN